MAWVTKSLLERKATMRLLTYNVLVTLFAFGLGRFVFGFGRG